MIRGSELEFGLGYVMCIDYIKDVGISVLVGHRLHLRSLHGLLEYINILS